MRCVSAVRFGCKLMYICKQCVWAESTSRENVGVASLACCKDTRIIAFLLSAHALRVLPSIRRAECCIGRLSDALQVTASAAVARLPQSATAAAALSGASNCYRER